MNMPYLLKVKKALKITRIPSLCRLGGLGKNGNSCTCLPCLPTGRRQAGSWQIFVTKFPENICGYIVAAGRDGMKISSIYTL